MSATDRTVRLGDRTCWAPIGEAVTRIVSGRGKYMNCVFHLQLRSAVVRREGRSLILVVPELGPERIVLSDPTGNVELLLELLAAGGLSRSDIIWELTSRRDGVEAPAVAAALDALDQLGLIVTSPCGPAQTERASRRVRAGNQALTVRESGTGLPCSSTLGVPAFGIRP